MSYIFQTILKTIGIKEIKSKTMKNAINGKLYKYTYLKHSMGSEKSQAASVRGEGAGKAFGM